MKDLKTMIVESKVESLLSEVQNESDKNAEYHTFDFTNGQKKFKKGFLTFNEDGEFITLTCFNTSKDFEELIGTEEGLYKEYDEIKVGECSTLNSNDGSKDQVLRIW